MTYLSTTHAHAHVHPVFSVTDDLLQRMSGVLQGYGVDPRELSQEQLYKLALILQLLQAQEKTGPTFNFSPVFLLRKFAI